MLSIALTGGIGSGKTAVTELFQQLASNSGFAERLHIVDADSIAHELLAGSLKINSSSALKQVHSLFGDDVFNSSGYLDRRQLRQLIFSSAHKKQQLENLLHPLIHTEIFSRISLLAEQNSNIIIIIAIPLLFESKADYHFDRILVIDLPVQLQLQRSSLRDQCSMELVQKIIDAQTDRQTRLDQADDIIDNSGSVAELQSQVESLFQYYLSLLADN